MIKRVTNKREKSGVITHLKVDGLEKTKEQVLNDIPNNDYYTYPNGLNGVRGALIHKVANKNLSTDSNNTTKDNLDELPDF